MTVTRTMDSLSRDFVDSRQFRQLAYPQDFVPPSPPIGLRLDSGCFGFEDSPLTNRAALQANRDVTPCRSRPVPKSAKNPAVTIAIWNIIGSSLIALTAATLASGLGFVSMAAAQVFVVGSGLAHLIAIYNLRQLGNSLEG